MSDELTEVPSAVAVAEHDDLAAAGLLRNVLLLDYRCPKGCLLLHVWDTPNARLYYPPRYQLSRATADAETVESARRKRTEDGERKWPAHGGSLDYLLEFFADEPDSGGLPLNCHHLRRTAYCTELAADMRQARRGSPTRRRLTT
jgi:hypothetical protein